MTNPEPTRFESIEDLLAHLGADSLEEAGELLSENLELDAFLQDDGDLVLRMGTQGATLEFPMTSDDFWELAHDLEQDVIADITVGSWPAHSSGELLYWNVDALFPENEPARVAKYRRLQSWYRERVLRARPGAFMNYEALGSYLHADEIKDRPDLNFLNGAAFAHAEEREAQVKLEGGTLEPNRLRQNLLSSMPLCFNLFGALLGEPEFLDLFRVLFDADAIRILDVVCEWAPQPPSEHLADRTAFDAVVFYETGVGPRFFGIETKYTEPFSAKEYESERYTAVTRESGWFSHPEQAIVELNGRKSNQLWRNVLLAASVEMRGEHGAGSVAVVALADDNGAAAAMEIVAPALEPGKLRFVSIESMLDAADELPALAGWSASFRQRYVGPLPD